MTGFINAFNMFLFFLFSLCYMYQVVYAVYVLVVDHKRKPNDGDVPLNRYAVLISGRNEEVVIGELVRSLKQQDYPTELIDVYVIADNCTDSTAAVAREAGAIVFERFDQVRKGKSYALNYALDKIRRAEGDEDGRTDYAGYFVFDADNVLDPGFIRAVNREVVRRPEFDAFTSYRNSKNYDDNWISSGSALWFLREAKFLSNARYRLGTSCAIGGTGFMVRAKILEDNEGWIHHLLTEDIEFSTDCIASGYRIGYVGDAIIYDEQPTTFRDSWRQRLRWAKGFYQVLLRYGARLVKGVGVRKGGRWACFDMFMTIAPAMLLTLTGVFANLFFCCMGLVQLIAMAPAMNEVITSAASAAAVNANPFVVVISLLTGSAFSGDVLSYITTENLAAYLSYGSARATIVASFTSFLGCFVAFAGIMLLFGGLTVITEWKQIHAKPAAKVKSVFTFPLFMLTYVPIALVAVFSKVEWKPIAHNVVRSAADITAKG